jgi:uncharacterized protein YciI
MKKLVSALLFFVFTVPVFSASPKDSTDIFIYKLRLTKKYENVKAWDDAASLAISKHVNFLDSLGKSGTLIFAGRTDLEPGDDNLFGIALIYANSLQQAIEIMSQDPAVLAGIQQSSVFPFRLAIRHFENVK